MNTVAKEQCFGDFLCEYQCDIDFVDCAYVCPCQAGCPQGCQGCSSAYCKCADPDTSPEYLECKERIIIFPWMLNIVRFMVKTSGQQTIEQLFKSHTINSRSTQRLIRSTGRLSLKGLNGVLNGYERILLFWTTVQLFAHLHIKRHSCW